MIDHNLLQNTVQDIIYKAKHISRGSISETILLYGKKKNYICKQPIMHILQNQKISDIISQYKISHIMYQNSFSVNKVKSYGVFET